MFVNDVLTAANPHVDFGPYDTDNDGDVDLVAVIVPEQFGLTCDANGTVFSGINYATGDTNANGNPVFVNTIITSDYRVSFPFMVGTLAHEYGHIMGLPELFDRDNQNRGGSTTPPAHDHSAGIGGWGVMARGSNGWEHIERRGGNSARLVDGPNPMSVWSRMQVGWITTHNKLVEVTGDMTNVDISDINSAAGRVYRIPVLGSLAPLPPEVGTATVATLSDPDEGIVFTGARWTWQRRAGETAGWEPVPAAARGTTDDYDELRGYTPVDADVGYQLRATVTYADHYDSDNYAASDASPAVVAATHRVLKITGPASVSHAEHDTTVVSRYTVTGEPGATITWSRLGMDAAAFTLDGGVLRFAVPPNFEAPADVDADNVYVVSVVARDGTLADTLDVMVSVANAEDVGLLVLGGLTSAPLVGTALVAQLTDEDGNITLTAAGWQWQRKQPHEAETAWENITAVRGTTETPPELHSYTPQTADVGY